MVTTVMRIQQKTENESKRRKYHFLVQKLRVTDSFVLRMISPTQASMLKKAIFTLHVVPKMKDFEFYSGLRNVIQLFVDTKLSFCVIIRFCRF